MLDVLIIIVTLFALLIASYTDLKTREVPDWLNYGLIFSAFGIRTIFSFELGWEILVAGIFGFLACFVLACLFYYSNQWGGGDSKLLMGMGAMIGISIPFSNQSWDLLFFFMILLLLGAIYGLFWMGYMAIKKRDLFLLSFKHKLHKSKKAHYSFLAMTLIFLLSSLIFSFFSSFLILLGVVVISFFYLLQFVTVVEKSCFVVNIGIPQLTEGDWLAEDVLVKGEIVMKKKTLEKNDLIKLTKLHSTKKLFSVLVKEGVPFVPSFLFAYLFLLLIKYFVPLGSLF